MLGINSQEARGRIGLKEIWQTWRSSVVLLPFAVYFSLSRGEYTLVDGADLIIHEAGHFFFRFFGEFAHMAGGTLMQILLPSLIVWHFAVHGYLLGMQVGLLWLGHNFINISVYAGDARARVLPLLGGPHVRHDWHYMLSGLGLLEYDYLISYAWFAMALLTFGILLVLPRASI